MSKQHIEQLILNALQSLQKNQQLTVDTTPLFQIEATKDKQHGDFACNVALAISKAAKLPPREIAAKIVAALPPSECVEKVDIAGPGFINFFLTPAALYSVIHEIIAEKDQYGKTNLGKGKRVIVEFVSANPNGPLHVGHGRHAAYGAVVADLLEAVGFDVYREYYVNDAGRQMDIVTVSTWLRYLSLCGDTLVFPANAYKGDYVIDMARKLQTEQKDTLRVDIKNLFQNLPQDEPDGGDKEIYIDALIIRAKELLGEPAYRMVFDLVLQEILQNIKQDLAEFGVHFQNWFSEREFVQTDAVDTMLEALNKAGSVYESEGALWFRSTEFGDEKDRVLQRSNGVRTYFANDLAYHINKFTRGFEHAIDIFGADHHGYIPRMRAGLTARGIIPDQLTYLLLQFVTLYRNGEQVQMSTRSGSFVTLRELREEVGNDSARFFYVMRKCEQHIDFDLDLAKSSSNENPVYYIQYAHARICSVFRQLSEKSISYDQQAGLKQLVGLTEPQELQLLTTLGRFTDTIKNAAKAHEPHLLTHYLRDLATHFHSYYNTQQFLVENEALRNARLTLIEATRQILVNGLKLLGVHAPESM